MRAFLIQMACAIALLAEETPQIKDEHKAALAAATDKVKLAQAQVDLLLARAEQAKAAASIIQDCGDKFAPFQDASGNLYCKAKPEPEARP